MVHQNTVSIDWVNKHLEDSSIVIVDCRFQLGAPEAGRTLYDEGHLPGAFHLDLEQDLSSPAGQHGGRHPLPNVDELAMKLGSLGIDGTKHVIAYDEGGFMAARLWWLLNYMGHPGGTSIMEGGYRAWGEAGFPTTSAPSTATTSTTFVPQIDTSIVIHIDELRHKLGQPGVLLLDSREAPRYRGEIEPIDPAAGHIPGAKNVFWKEGMDEQGNWRSREEQQARFAAVGAKDADEIIVYCGSGVSACPNVLALREAGYRNVKLYAGSWSDWVSYADNPIAIGEE
jgi:thiosulfate/3-mercaptopyruvate sulfurtransferase